MQREKQNVPMLRAMRYPVGKEFLQMMLVTLAVVMSHIRLTWMRRMTHEQQVSMQEEKDKEKEKAKRKERGKGRPMKKMISMTPATMVMVFVMMPMV